MRWSADLLGLVGVFASACAPRGSAPAPSTPATSTPAAAAPAIRPGFEPPEIEPPSETRDRLCRIEGYDFAYGYARFPSTAEPAPRVIECGMGPGTPCDEATTQDTCESASTHLFCLYRRLTAEDCREQCTMVGDIEAITYERGRCSDLDGKAGCVCCDGPKCAAYRSPR